MSLLSLMSSNGPSGFGYASTAEEVTVDLDLSSKTYLVTGCGSGIGQESLRVLALRGATVLGAARTQEKADAACAPFGKQARGLECELSEPESVRTCVSSLLKEGVRLDAIICNAGIMALPELTLKHGIELQFLTNHVGHFMLVTGLLSTLTEEGRIVVLSSAAHQAAPREGIDFGNLRGEGRYRPWAFYGQSKLANLLFVKELANRLSGTTQTTLAVHPGVISTPLLRNMGLLAHLGYALAGPLALKSIPQGASTQVFAATHPSLKGLSGEYLASCNRKKCSELGRDAALAQRLWAESESIIAML